MHFFEVDLLLDDQLVTIEHSNELMMMAMQLLHSLGAVGHSWAARVSHRVSAS
jgi:hypothetical protein